MSSLAKQEPVPDRDGSAGSQTSLTQDATAAFASAGGHRAAARLDAKRREIARRESTEPLRRRILGVLAQEPAAPREIADILQVPPESISRQLKGLREARLVNYSGEFADRRRRQYRLTADGEVALSQHRAFGASETGAPTPTDEQLLAFLQTSLRKAVGLRRKTNRLAEASARLRLILEQAEEAGASEIAVEATAELATTLRQDRDFEHADTLLKNLERISLGNHPDASPTLSLPAAAHYAYALGRLRDEHRETIAERAEHLTTAVQLYAQLADSVVGAATRSRWQERQAWALVSLANNLRARSRFDDALGYTRRALGVFEDLDDTYGRSRCQFMTGFCLRLMGDFDGASQELTQAHELAVSGAFERFQADALLQLGEVRRCQGQVEVAGMMLEEALERARHMNLTVIQAFAVSARGAVYFQQREPEKALDAMLSAHSLFDTCEHPEGLALNARRQAIVLRVKYPTGGAGRTVNRLLDFALRRYHRLRSPAGIAACEIERGRLELRRAGHATSAIRSLNKRLSDPDQHALLVRDPWVPSVLHDFVCGLELEPGAELLSRAERLLTGSRLAVDELSRRWVERSQEEPPPRTRITARNPASDRYGADEMGGEARRYQEPIAMDMSR